MTLRSYVITDVDTENECGVMKTQSAEGFFLLWICVFLIITVVLNLNKKKQERIVETEETCFGLVLIQ